MKRTLISNILLALGAALFLSIGASAQDENTQTPANVRPNQQVRIMRELNLTQQQVQQIRRINVERKPLIQQAQMKLRQANRALDAAIYADDVNEEVIRERMKDVALAQAEVTRVKTFTEVLIRKVLTPEQLGKFRELRERLMQPKNEIKEQPARPIDRLRNRQNRIPVD